ncbi:uncharacterized protein LOC144768137 isoform X2 [Lissotriton helveticus]
MRMDKYENHGVVPEGVICSESPDAPYFSDFCTFAHYRCAKKKYYLRRVNCPNDVQSDVTSMAQKYRLMDEDGDTLENPPDQDLYEMSLSSDRSPAMGTIREDLQFTSSRRPGKSTNKMPLVRYKEFSKVTFPMFTNENSGPFSIRTLLVKPSEVMTEKTTVNISWLFPGSSGQETITDNPTFLHKWRGQMKPSPETEEDFAISSRLDEGVMASDREEHLRNDDTWQDRMSDLRQTPSKKKRNKVFIALQHESTTEEMLRAMPSKKMAVKQSFSSSSRWSDPKMSLKRTTLKIMETLPPYQEMPKARIVESRGSSFLPTLAFHVRTTAPSGEPVFSGSVNQPNARSIFGSTLTTKFATGMIYRNSRTPFFLRASDEENLREMTMDERLPEEPSEEKVSVTALNQQTITVPGIRNQIAISTPRKWVSEITPIQRGLQVMPKHTTLVTTSFRSPSILNVVDVTIPKEEAIFSQGIHRLMPTNLLDTTNKVKMTWTQNIHPMIKQRPVQLILKDEVLEMNPIERLVDVTLPKQGLHQWNTQSIAGKMPTQILIAETSPNYEVIPSNTLHPGRYAKSRTVVSLGNEKANNAYIRLVTSKKIPCPGSQGGFHCTQTSQDSSSPYNNLASDFTSQKLRYLRFTSNSARSGINSPSPKYTIEEINVKFPKTGSDENLLKALSKIPRSNYNDFYKVTLTTLGRRTIDSDRLMRLLPSNKITFYTQQNPDMALTSSIASLRSASNKDHLDIMAVQHREPSLKGHHYIDNWPLPSNAHPLRITVARSRSGGEIWRGDIVDLYQRLQDPRVQRLSQELEEELSAQGARQDTAHVNRADLQKLSLRLMKALSRMRVRM